MKKQTKGNTAPYSKAERRAENEIDQFIQSMHAPATQTILEQLKSLS